MPDLTESPQESLTSKRHVPVRLRVRDEMGFEKTVLFNKSLLRIGRDPGSDLRIDHPSIAPCHVLILRDGSRYQFTDTSGGPGTFINGRKVVTGELAHGDRINFGAGCPYEAFFLVEGERSDDSQERNLRTLLTASKAINSSLVHDQVLEKVMDSVMAVSRAGKGFLMLIEPDGSLRARVTRNIDRAALDQEIIPASRSVIQQVLESRKSVFVMTEESGAGAPRTMSIVRLNLKAVMCVPILSPEKLIGVIYVDHQERVMNVTKTDLEILESLADHASVAIENARLTERMLLAERVSTVGRMVSSIVHDLRGPLAGIRAAAQLLQGNPESPKGPRLTSMIITEVDRMAGMAQEVLDYCRGKMEVNAARTDLSALLSRTLEPLRDSLEARSVSLNLDLGSPAAPPLDASRMERVIRNLIDNAVDAMPEGGVLTVSTRIERGRTVVCVTDTGIGMPEEVRRRIFEPFFTHGKKNGNGLGMAIAARIVEAHGGEMDVDSAPGEGTTVSLTLPLEPAAKREEAMEPAAAGASR